MTEFIGKEFNPLGVKKADIVVGIPSFNEADTIALPVKQAAEGLKQYFSEYTSVIVNCDANSTDGTKEVFLDTPSSDIPKIYLSAPSGVSGKGNMVRMLVQKACEMEAKAIVVLDANSITITPKWIKNLVQPLFENFSFVSPLYVRHKYDNMITNIIAYPLLRALYGRRIRQPIGGDFAFDNKLAQIFAETTYWNEAVGQFGIDIWMVTIAVNTGVHVCQSFMGRPKIHKICTVTSTASVFSQIISVIFDFMEIFAANWKKVKWSKPTAIFGFGLGEIELPPPVEVDKDVIYKEFQKGFKKYSEIWEEFLAKPNLNKLKEIKTLPFNYFDFPTELWAKILYDFAVGYQKAKNKKLLIDSLAPLYSGKMLSYIKKTQRMSIQEVEEFTEYECEAFEKIKPYLLERWNT